MTDREDRWDYAVKNTAFWLAMLQRKFSDKEILTMLSQKKLKAILGVLNTTDWPND